MTNATTAPRHLSMAELEAGLAHVAAAPRDRGTIELIVARPSRNERNVLERAALDAELGLVGDYWSTLGRASKNDQLTLMNTRAIDLVAGSRAHWPLAGDQVYVDLDLGVENVPPGTRLELGSAVVEASDEPHAGCAKFRDRFGRDAVRLFNSREGRRMQLRGINAFVVVPGEIGVGDAVEKLEQ